MISSPEPNGNEHHHDTNVATKSALERLPTELLSIVMSHINIADDYLTLRLASRALNEHLTKSNDSLQNWLVAQAYPHMTGKVVNDPAMVPTFVEAHPQFVPNFKYLLRGSSEPVHNTKDSAYDADERVTNELRKICTQPMDVFVFLQRHSGLNAFEYDNIIYSRRTVDDQELVVPQTWIGLRRRGDRTVQSPLPLHVLPETWKRQIGISQLFNARTLVNDKVRSKFLSLLAEEDENSSGSAKVIETKMDKVLSHFQFENVGYFEVEILEVPQPNNFSDIPLSEEEQNANRLRELYLKRESHVQDDNVSLHESISSCDTVETPQISSRKRFEQYDTSAIDSLAKAYSSFPTVGNMERDVNTENALPLREVGSVSMRVGLVEEGYSSLHPVGCLPNSVGMCSADGYVALGHRDGEVFQLSREWGTQKGDVVGCGFILDPSLDRGVVFFTHNGQWVGESPYRVGSDFSKDYRGNWHAAFSSFVSCTVRFNHGQLPFRYQLFDAYKLTDFLSSRADSINSISDMECHIAEFGKKNGNESVMQLPTVLSRRWKKCNVRAELFEKGVPLPKARIADPSNIFLLAITDENTGNDEPALTNDIAQHPANIELHNDANITIEIAENVEQAEPSREVIVLEEIIMQQNVSNDPSNEVQVLRVDQAMALRRDELSEGSLSVGEGSVLDDNRAGPGGLRINPWAIPASPSLSSNISLANSTAGIISGTIGTMANFALPESLNTASDTSSDVSSAMWGLSLSFRPFLNVGPSSATISLERSPMSPVDGHTLPSSLHVPSRIPLHTGSLISPGPRTRRSYVPNPTRPSQRRSSDEEPDEHSSPRRSSAPYGRTSLRSQGEITSASTTSSTNMGPLQVPPSPSRNAQVPTSPGKNYYMSGIASPLFAHDEFPSSASSISSSPRLLCEQVEWKSNGSYTREIGASSDTHAPTRVRAASMTSWSPLIPALSMPHVAPAAEPRLTFPLLHNLKSIRNTIKEQDEAANVHLRERDESFSMWDFTRDISRALINGSLSKQQLQMVFDGGEYIFPGNSAVRATTIQCPFPMEILPPFLSEHVRYFEVELLEAGSGSNSFMSLGLATRPYTPYHQVGWGAYSVGLHTDDGKIYNNVLQDGIDFAEPIDVNLIQDEMLFFRRMNRSTAQASQQNAISAHRIIRDGWIRQRAAARVLLEARERIQLRRQRRAVTALARVGGSTHLRPPVRRGSLGSDGNLGGADDDEVRSVLQELEEDTFEDVNSIVAEIRDIAASIERIIQQVRPSNIQTLSINTEEGSLSPSANLPRPPANSPVSANEQHPRALDIFRESFPVTRRASVQRTVSIASPGEIMFDNLTNTVSTAASEIERVANIFEEMVDTTAAALAVGNDSDVELAEVVSSAGDDTMQEQQQVPEQTPEVDEEEQLAADLEAIRNVPKTVLGCGIDMRRSQVFFTRDGILLGTVPYSWDGYATIAAIRAWRVRMRFSDFRYKGDGLF